jgi:hypothetical protein
MVSWRATAARIERAADDVAPRVAEAALGGVVPVDDDAVHGGDNDGVLGARVINERRAHGVRDGIAIVLAAMTPNGHADERGQSDQRLECLRRNRLAIVDGEHALQIQLAHQRHAGERGQPFTPAPVLAVDERIVQHGVGEVRLTALGNAADAELARGNAAAFVVRAERQSGGRLHFQHAGLRRPDAADRDTELADDNVGAFLQERG